ncbi:MAG TPA: hypothetical protein VGX16_00990 [Solirubrobacteraceae bacterium]|jgi:hypothetical protein|nr:hypothetical protein [Solirubrobacteraceae bacterium]
MHDEFRVRVEVQTPKELMSALRAIEPDGEGHEDLGRLAVTHEGDHVFLYADSLTSAQSAQGAVERAMHEQGMEGAITLWRWHPLEERWEDAAVPLPSSEEERAAEHARLEQQEIEESRAAGFPEWEVRVTLPSHHDARDFAERLQGEGIPVAQRWRHLFVGAEDEDDAAALAERLRVEAPAGSEIVTEGNALPYWRMLHRYAVFGGIAN